MLIDKPYVSVDPGRAVEPLVLRAHIAILGDRVTNLGWIRPAGARSNIQGFSLVAADGKRCDIWYRARLASGIWTDWVNNGKFVGTRGKHEDLAGFSVRLGDVDRDKFKLEAIGKFVNDPEFVRIPDGGDCLPLSGNGALCGMQIILYIK